MCGTNKIPEGWTKDWPTEEGDYLWIEQWGCGCIIKSGIVWIVDAGDYTWEPDYKYKNFYAVFEGENKPLILEGEPIINWFKKIEVPPGASYEDLPEMT